MAKGATHLIVQHATSFASPERFSRHDRSAFSEWWWSIDRIIAILMLVLCAIGVVAVFAAGASVADTINMSSRRTFAMKHLFFASTAVGLMLWLSFFTPRAIRRLGVIMFVVGMPLLAATLLVGKGIKGAKRWLYFAGMQVQPSEFLKPAFVLLAAWLMAHALAPQSRLPGRLLATGAFLCLVSVLLMQPDVGQSMLLTVVWTGMLFMTGAAGLWFVLGGVGGVAGFGLLYLMFAHVRNRIDHFLFADDADIYGAGYQINKAQAALYSGGWWGKGPGEGVVKQSVPDAHSDYIFTIVGEEFGLIACGILILCYAVIVQRALAMAARQNNTFITLSVTGLSLLFGMQAFINMAVNVGVLPPKGMTLPFVSYGGSSSLAVGITAGMLLALTRRRVGVSEF